MLPVLLLIFVVLFFGVLVSLITYARWNYRKLDNLGFPVIPPSFVLGSVPDVHKHVQHFEDIKRNRIFGPIWGIHQGRTPIVFIADPDLIKQIFVKDSSHFYNREPFEFGDPILNQILDYLPGEKWKTLRVSQTKLFSSGKIKQYSNQIFKTSMERFIDKMEEDINSSPVKQRVTIDTRERFCTFTLSAIGESLLSMKVDDTDDAFYTSCKRLIGDGQSTSPFYVWTHAFPFLARFEPTLILDPVMTKRFQALIASRLTSGDKCDDYGDVMVDIFKKLESDNDLKRLGITETTILGQAVNLFLAGFDRISTVLTFMAYHLAKDSDRQAKLHEEIDLVVDGQNGGNINNTILSELPYLNACILEASRLYPTLIRPERVCNKDWICAERGIKITKGVVVQIAAWAVNRNPDVYESPDEFMPERFLPQNKSNLNPYAYSSFGFGHRGCIGMRFSYEAMRWAMCKMMHRYRFEMNEKTKVKFKPGIIFITQYEPVYIDVVQRKKTY